MPKVHATRSVNVLVKEAVYGPRCSQTMLGGNICRRTGSVKLLGRWFCQLHARKMGK